MKQCNACTSKALVHLRSMNLKICADCGNEIEWRLDEGQRPLIDSSRGGKKK